ncbi:exodeoxyribonuclease V subunit beta [Thiohalorhabdus sp.]|uniref:exodeoxyribonuclease V subunit beta n=1 Tax=Thiohalorhabdus sp. TaxID=3094134 RepID=UPI002FC3B3E2
MAELIKNQSDPGSVSPSQKDNGAARSGDAQRTELLLRRAVQSFDQAAIYTIHGYCQRALSDHAFEGRRPFEMELVTDPSELIQEVIDDFWRQKAPTLDRPFLDYLLDKGMGPEKLAGTIRSYLGKPDVVIRSPETDDGVDFQAYADAYTRARELWQTDKPTIHQRLLDGLDGYKSGQYDAAKIAGWVDKMDAHLAGETPPSGWFEKFQKLSASGLESGTKKGNEVPDHPFFDAMDEVAATWEPVAEAFEARAWTLVHEALSYAWAELPRRKETRRVQAFDDLMLNLDRALDGPAGETLATTLRERLPVALIDEFQDTDPVQYRIFHRIYGEAVGPIFLVGDPKQAIYGFRGADIFAYLRARGDTETREDGHTHYLPKNWRSTAKLVTAFNDLFQRNRPFWFDAIPYKEVASAHPKESLELPDFDPAPFQWHFLPLTPNDDKKKNKGAATEVAVQETAAEIARLLDASDQGEARLTHPDHGERPLTGKDIAVLVRTHKQAQAVRNALSQRGIASVEQARESVFATPDAEELERVLAAIQEPHRDDLLRAALATTLYGHTAAELYALTQDEDHWDRIADGFQVLHDHWRAHGFMGLFRHWLATEGIQTRLLAQSEGERRLTNLLHIAELLHRQAQEADLGMEGVLAWLGQRRQSPGTEGEEEELRLESEADLVQLVTIHKSKGLEYPIVFCPFLWDLAVKSPDKNQAVDFHDPDNDNRLTVDLGTEEREAAKHRKQEETLAENLRLLYVAITRAVHRLYLLTGPINELDKSAFGYLIHATAEPGYDWNAATKTVPTADPETLYGHLEAFVDARPEVFGLTAHFTTTEGGEGPRRQAPTPPKLAEQRFTGSVATDRFVTSFSGLIEGQPADRPEADRGENVWITPSLVTEAPLEGPARFPKGRAAGTCLHGVLEHIDFTTGPEEWHEPMARTLREHGFDPEQWGEIVTDLVANTVATRLGGGLAGHSLQGIGAGARLDEMEFYYPLARLTDSTLSRVLADYGYHPGAASPEAGPALAFRPQAGYLRGFIDLVFEADGRYYLADYKSNWLGPNAAAYTDAALAKAVAEHGYALQYLLYSVALHRHLQASLPGYRYADHFGGAYYLFLRGMDPERGEGAGVYFDRPDEGLIQALDGLFRGEG